MAIIKSYTDIEQSKKLAKILPIESADMGYLWNGTSFCEYPVSSQTIFKKVENVPCWSLAALLGVLPLPDLVQDKADDELFWQCSVYDEDGTQLCVTYDNNPIDACVEMIEELHERKIL